MLTHDKISRSKCHILDIVFTIFLEIRQELVGRKKVGTTNKYLKNARESIGTEVINSEHL